MYIAKRDVMGLLRYVKRVSSGMLQVFERVTFLKKKTPYERKSFLVLRAEPPSVKLG